MVTHTWSNVHQFSTDSKSNVQPRKNTCRQCLGGDTIANPHTDNIHPHMTLLKFTWDSQCGNTALPIHLAALVWHLRQASIHPKCMRKATYCSPRWIVENVTYMYALIHLLWANTAQTSITCPVRYWDLVFYIVQLQENNKCFRTQIWWAFGPEKPDPMPLCTGEKPQIGTQVWDNQYFSDEYC